VFLDMFVAGMIPTVLFAGQWSVTGCSLAALGQVNTTSRLHRGGAFTSLILITDAMTSLLSHQ
jgi:hypothetical protein